MKKSTSIIAVVLIGIIIISIVGVIIYFGYSSVFISVVPQSLIPGYGDEKELYYQDHKPGVCKISVRNLAGGLDQFEIDVGVRVNGNKIMKTFDGTPRLPISYDSFYGENGCQSHGLTYTDYPSFWDLVRIGSIERQVEYCPFGTLDPTPFDGLNNYKCDGLCIPNSAICRDDNTLLRCRGDGNSIETITCGFKCEDGICLELDYNLFIDTNRNSYNLGDDILVNGRFTQPTNPATPIQGVLVTAQIIKNNAVIRELSEYTDSLGEINLVFTNINSVGEVEIKLSLTHLNKLYEKNKIVNVAGELITFEVTTYSYTQYETEPIKFTVLMKDSQGRYVYPEKLTNLRGIATLTSGQVLNSSVEFKGNGEYEITSNVVGVGRYVGKLAFEFEGTPHDSPIIEIDVEKIRISVDTSEIIPVATLGEDNEYTIRLYDSLGNKLDPDDLYIEIDFPDGITTDLIPFNEFTKVEEGVYTFNYNFPQVEKFTLNILADKTGYVRGSAKASVAVSGEKELVAGPKWFKYLIYIIPIGIVLFFIFAYIFWRAIKR